MKNKESRKDDFIPFLSFCENVQLKNTGLRTRRKKARADVCSSCYVATTWRPLRLSRWKLALVSEDYHSEHPGGGLSDSVGMHFFHVFVVVVVLWTEVVMYVTVNRW